MDIEQVEAGDGATIAELVAMRNRAAQHDSPWEHALTLTGYQGVLRHGWDGEPPRVYLAREGGAVVGAAELWTSEWDNTDLAWLRVCIDPEARRRGRGGDLLEFVAGRARALGRTSAGSDGWDCDGTRRFAARHGFERRSQSLLRRQDVADLDRSRLDELYGAAAAAASSYELVRNAGRTPDALLADVVTLSEAINDAPVDDLEVEDDVFTPERVRAYEDATIGRGRRLYRLLARHRDTGELAGHTVVAVERERPTIAHQHDTSVVRAHRGHRLGLLLKAGMLAWLAETEPRLESIDTWNAESNDHMIAVNEELGYRVMGRALQFQRSI